MAATRTTFTIDDDLVRRAHELGVNVSAAARDGVASAVERARDLADRAAYQRHPETVDDAWEQSEAWTAP